MALLSPSTLVGICGYRKILVRGEKAFNKMTLAECALLPREQTEPFPGHEYLLCRHDFFEIGRIHRCIREQWKDAHLEVDLRDCLNLAVEMGILKMVEIRLLEEEPVLIEGGFSMGVYPGSLLRSVINKVFPLYTEFAKRYASRFMEYDPVQRRCIAFMAERIETHFILKDLRQRYPGGIPKEVFGTLMVVNDGPWSSGTMP